MADTLAPTLDDLRELHRVTGSLIRCLEYRRLLDCTIQVAEAVAALQEYRTGEEKR